MDKRKNVLTYGRAALRGLLALLVFVLLQLGAAQSAQAQTTDFDHASTGFVLNAQHQTARCETCHVKGVFKGTPTDCASCHGWNNPRAATVMPTNHIPTSNISCEACHASNQALFIDATRTFSHVNVRALTCASCHSSNNPHPNVRVNPTDATHQAVLAANKSCDQCHTTTQFTGPKVPSNHIPTAAVPCAACHTSTDYSVMPTISAIHANAQSTSSNCQQCHSAAAVAAYGMATMVPPLVGPVAGHIGMSGQSCEACHVGPNSSITRTPVVEGNSFANSAFNHAGNTGTCASCHGAGVTATTFFRVSPKTVSSLTPAHIPFTTGCDTCHVNSVPVGQIPLTAASGSMTSFANGQFSHSGITTACGTCHGAGVSPSSFYGVVPVNTALLNPAHIPSSAACETCHINSIPSTLVSATGAGATVHFSGAPFSHTGISSNCATCHGPSVGNSSFFGVTSIVVMPPIAQGSHLPTSTTCENCHAGSVPTAALSVSAAHTLPGSGFRNAPPAASQIHADTTAACSTCHEAGMNWMGLDLPLYNRVPASFTGVASDLYRGFQTRPVAGGTATSVSDSRHPTGECSLCHGNTTAFGATIEPTNHIPYAANTACSACHVNFNVAPTVGATHANIQSTSSNCDQCHAPDKAAYYSAKMQNSIVTLPNLHIARGTLSCEGCHVGTNSSIAITPVPDGAKFSGSLFNHAGATTTCSTCHGATVSPGRFTGVYSTNFAALSPVHVPTTAECDTCHLGGAPVGLVPSAGMTTFAGAQFSHTGISTGCASCHGPNINNSSFYGVNPIVVMPASDPLGGTASHLPTSTTCEDCHLGSKPSMPVAASASRSVPGSLFQTPEPTALMIHKGVSGNCSSCHEQGMTWLGMQLSYYARNPSTLSGLPTTLYKGFQTRPNSSGSGNSILNGGHPDMSMGDCSLCHGNTVAFGAASEPAGHIPYAASAVCSDCHTTFGVTPTVGAIHAKIQSLSNNCEQCHSTDNAALYAATTTKKPIKTPASNHIPMGGLGCDKCHVGGGSNIAGIPVATGSLFSGSGFSHSGITTGCSNCHGPNVTVGTFDGVTPMSVAGQTPAHIPVSNNVGCEICHANSIPPGLVPPTGYSGSPSFSGGKFSHSGITSGCDACHGPNVLASSFKGVSGLVVMPPSTGTNAHIPTSTTCENCHAGSIPTALLSVSASHTVPGSGFANAPPDTTKIHADVSGGCNSCHEAGKSWVGMLPAYPRVPSTLSSNPAQKYTGFHTRPLRGAASGFSMTDSSHPDLGECSQCHGDFAAFGAPTQPANHIPYVSGTSCTACHKSWGTSPTVADIHANIQSTSANCVQCHSDANATLYSTASRAIVGPGANHVPMRTLSCENCHVGAGSSMTSTPVPDGANFANSAFRHTGMTSNCAECHGPTIKQSQQSFRGINTIVVMPPSTTANSSNHIPSSTTCENCHSASMPSALVPGNAAHVAPNSGFTSPLPTTTMTHGGVTGNCMACHDTGMDWMGANLYPTHKTPLYTGFHTRPTSGGGTYSVSDAQHPGGECSSCHTGFNEWATNVKPSNHIPTANVSCDKCHTSSPVNYSTMPDYGLIHLYAPSTTANCAQCHSAANAAAYKTANLTIKAPDTNHIPMANLGCESCHVGTGLGVPTTPVPSSALFNNSAFDHSGATVSCATCHGTITGSTFQGGIIPVTMTTPVLTPVHVPNPANLDCGICHLNIPVGKAKIGSSSTTFAAGQFSHTGISTGCDACHGASITGGSFKGINTIVVLPPTSAGGHIPSPINASCETCHLGTKPATLVSASSTNASLGSTKFRLPAPNGTMIHTGITTGCNNCHEAGNSWANVATLYPIAPTTKTANATYTGFHTRPGTASTTSVADTSHPGVSVGDCSDCHGSTVNFSAVAKPTNHIPTSTTAQCQNCHTNLTVGTDGLFVSSSVNFATLPTVTNIHQYAPSTTSNCAQCHSAANAASYAIASVNFTIKSPASVANHIPFGTTGCEVCHVYSGGPLTTPVLTGASFAGGKFSHAGFTTGCSDCHVTGKGPFTGVTALVAVAPTTATPGGTTHIPYTASCETCHALTVPSGLVAVTSTANKFASPLTAGTTVHANSPGIACKDCHERAFTWLGMANYPRTPLAVNTTVATTQYNGFQTRPGASGAAGQYGYVDAAHTGDTSLDTGDCSLCHAGTTAFTGEGKPAGHMPTTVASCTTCHLSAGDYSYAPGKLASNSVLHTGITIPAAVTKYSAVPASNAACTACHTAGTGSNGMAPFAGCATQTACSAPPPISYQPATVAKVAAHIPIGTLGCDACHVGTAAFSGVVMSSGTAASTMHANVALAKIQCQSCHEYSATPMWTNLPNIKTRVPSKHTTADRKAPNDCSKCHSFNGGFRGLQRPVMRQALAAPGGDRLRPAIPTSKPSRGSLGNAFDHKGVAVGQCKTCHDGKSASGMPARHLMVSNSCDTCHRTTTWTPAQFNHNGVTPNTCQACHNGMGASGKPAGHFLSTRSCDSCHKSQGWKPVMYQHLSPLYKPSPDMLTCVSCHVTNGEIIPRQMRGLSRTKPIPVGP